MEDHHPSGKWVRTIVSAMKKFLKPVSMAFKLRGGFEKRVAQRKKSAGNWLAGCHRIPSCRTISRKMDLGVSYDGVSRTSSPFHDSDRGRCCCDRLQQPGCSAFG